jgi:hypothetical protein
MSASAKIRLFGLGLIALGLLFAWFFVYLPVHDGPDGFVGRGPIKALVFVPLACVIGLGLLVGGGPVLDAFQSKRRTRGQWAVVWSLLLSATAISGVTFWLIRTRWAPPPKGPPVVREFRGVPPPSAPRPEWQPPSLPRPSGDSAVPPVPPRPTG